MNEDEMLKVNLSNFTLRIFKSRRQIIPVGDHFLRNMLKNFPRLDECFFVVIMELKGKRNIIKCLRGHLKIIVNCVERCVIILVSHDINLYLPVRASECVCVCVCACARVCASVFVGIGLYEVKRPTSWIRFKLNERKYFIFCPHFFYNLVGTYIWGNWKHCRQALTLKYEGNGRVYFLCTSEYNIILLCFQRREVWKERETCLPRFSNVTAYVCWPNTWIVVESYFPFQIWNLWKMFNNFGKFEE
jgi:hypothetical protein